MSTARILGTIAALTLFAGLVGACELPPVFTVTSTGDAVDADPGDGTCETATAGECTLRAAVQEANALAEAVAIHLAASSTYTLAIAGPGEDLGVSGDLDTTGNISLYGYGSTIDANLIDRVLDHRAGVLFIHDTTLRSGSMSEGAGIRNAADLHLIDSTVTNTRNLEADADGGAIYQTAGNLKIARSVVSGHTGLETVSGGVVQLGGTVGIVDSLISGNVALGDAFELNQLGGQATIVNSSLRSDDRLIPIPFCGEFGCVLLDVAITSTAMKVEGNVTIARSTIAHRVFDGTTIMYGSGAVDASGSILYGTCIPDVTSSGYNAVRAANPCVDAPDATDLALAAAPLESEFVPVAGEPVIDAIPPGTPVLCSAAPDHDRRQLPRPQGAGCDIGAIERQPSDPDRGRGRRGRERR